MAQNNSALLANLARSLNIELAFDSDNVCELLIDDDAVVTLSGDPDSTTLRILGVVGDLEDPSDPAALQLLLQANYNGQGVGEASLGMDHVSLEVFLTQSVDAAALGHEGLSPVLECFVNYLAFWRKHLGKLAAPGASAGDFNVGAPQGVRV